MKKETKVAKVELRLSHGVSFSTYVLSSKPNKKGKVNRTFAIQINVHLKGEEKPERTRILIPWEQFHYFKQDIAAAESKGAGFMYRKACSYFEDDKWGRKKKEPEANISDLLKRIRDKDCCR